VYSDSKKEIERFRDANASVGSTDAVLQASADPSRLPQHSTRITLAS